MLTIACIIAGTVLLSIQSLGRVYSNVDLLLHSSNPTSIPQTSMAIHRAISLFMATAKKIS